MERNMSKEFKLTPEEKQGLEELPLEKDIPYKLEKELFNMLKTNRLIVNNRSRKWLQWAASLLLVGIAYLAGYWQGNSSTSRIEKATFLFMLQHDMAFITQDVDFVSEYRNWRDLTLQSRFVHGDEIAVEPSMLKKPGSEFGDEILSGFFLVEAENYEEAEIVARSHPHFKLGGTIQIRKLIKH